MRSDVGVASSYSLRVDLALTGSLARFQFADSLCAREARGDEFSSPVGTVEAMNFARSLTRSGPIVKGRLRHPTSAERLIADWDDGRGTRRQTRLSFRFRVFRTRRSRPPDAPKLVVRVWPGRRFQPAWVDCTIDRSSPRSVPSRDTTRLVQSSHRIHQPASARG